MLHYYYCRDDGGKRAVHAKRAAIDGVPMVDARRLGFGGFEHAQLRPLRPAGLPQPLIVLVHRHSSFGLGVTARSAFRPPEPSIV